MINNSLFTNNLQRIFEYYELSASSFAEKIGVGRSSISHIISGRNKPSLDLVLNILEKFEEVSFDWLVLGKGNFPNKNNGTPTLFSQQSETHLSGIVEKNNAEVENKSNITPKTPANVDETIKTYSNSVSQNPIERIVVFFNNGTFKEYHN